MGRNGKKPVRDPQTGELVLAPRKTPPRLDTVFRRLERSIPRQELEEIMATAPDERAQQLFRMLADPYIGKKSLPQLAKECGMTYPQVLQLITRYRMDQGMLRMTKHVGDVMEDVAIDAKSKEVTCPNCEGATKIAVTEIIDDPDKGKKIIVQKLDDEGVPIWKKCLVCDGAGIVRQVGDADSRKLMFESLKLTGRGPGQMVQVNVGGGATMEDTVASV